MNELSEMIRTYIHECFDNQNRIPNQDEIYVQFKEYDPPEYIIEDQVNDFFNGYYILPNTVVEYDGPLRPTVQIEMEEAK